MGISLATPRVLLVSDVYFPRVNGVSTSIQTFRADLLALGCDTTLVAPRYPTGMTNEPGIVRIPSRYLPFDPEDRLMRRRAFERACASIAGRFDLIHIQTPFMAHTVGVRLARRLGLKVVETYHTYFETYFHHYLPFLPVSILRRIARLISRRQCDAVDAVVAPSEPMAEILREYGVSAPIHVIPTGLDIATFSGGDRDRFRAALGIDPGRPVMLTVSRVAFEKNIHYLVEILAEVRRSVADVLFVIAGEGPALPALKRQVVQAGLAEHVRFVGYLDRGTGLLDCYRAADVFVFASKTETQGLVLLEAMGLGLPVVSTAVAGTRAVLANARGALIAAEDDHAQFAAAVVNVLTNAELRGALSSEARAFVATCWSSAEMARRMLALYMRVLEEPTEQRRLGALSPY